MSIFNDDLIEAMYSGIYHCSKCGADMEFETEGGDVLVCPKCGHSIDYDRYGAEDDESYYAMYPTKEEVCGYEDDDEEIEED